MSTLKVNTIQDTTGNDALTIDSSGNVTASQGFVPSTQLSHRNLIINGDMTVAQRGTSETGVTSSGIYTVDRWNYQESGGSTVTLTQENSGTRPVGFNKFHRVEVTTADSTTDSTDFATLKYIIEAQDVHCLNYGTSEARDFTLSFWVRSSVTGTYSVAFYSQASTSYSYSTSYTINSANTWEYKTITVPGNTTQAHDDANYGIQVRFMMTSGSGKTQTTADTWQSGNYWGVSGQTQMMETSGATWDLTGVQLEVGSVATPFEHRSYGEELARCQRYYERVAADTSEQRTFATGKASSSTNLRTIHYMKTVKRASPTISGTTVRCDVGADATSPSLWLTGLHNVGIDYTTSGLSTNNMYLIYNRSATADYVEFDAEL